MPSIYELAHWAWYLPMWHTPVGRTLLILLEKNSSGEEAAVTVCMCSQPTHWQFPLEAISIAVTGNRPRWTGCVACSSAPWPWCMLSPKSHQDGSGASTITTVRVVLCQLLSSLCATRSPPELTGS